MRPHACGNEIFGIFLPATRILHSWPALLLSQTPNPAVSQHSSKKCVYGLLTSGEAFQSAGASFHFQVSVQVNTAMRAWGPYVGIVGRVGDKCKNSLRHSGGVSEGDEQHLVGHCVLVGERLLARQVLVHRWNNLQDVVVRGQSCSGNNTTKRVQKLMASFLSQPSIKLTLQEWRAHVQVAYSRLDASRSAPPKALKAPFTWCICAK